MIRQFAGPDYLQHAIDPADRKKLFEREPTVRHYAITDQEAIPLMRSGWRSE